MGGRSSLWEEHSPMGTQGAPGGPSADPADRTPPPATWSSRCGSRSPHHGPGDAPPRWEGEGKAGQEGLGSGLG